jgi:iron complex transport system ATP-binding protein
MSLVSLVSVSAGYGETVVIRDVGFSAEPGELLVVLGPNGAGKTTLLRTIAGLHKPLSGKVLLRGTDVYEMNPRDRAKHIAYVPSALPSPGLGQSVAEFVAAGLYPARSGLALGPSRGDLEKAEKLLGKLGIGGLASRPLYATSSGERQRAQLAHALIRGPEVLVVDEPTSFQDMYGRVLMYSVLREYAESGRLVIVATHDMVLAALYATRILLLDKGRVVGDGDPGEVLARDVLERVFNVEIVFAEIGGRRIPVPVAPKARRD